MGAIALPSRKKLPFLRECKNKIIFVLTLFHFCPKTEKLCPNTENRCYVLILLKMSIGASEIIRNKSSRDNNVHL